VTPGSDSRPGILIVEDERLVAKDLQQTLNELGYDAYAMVASADEALAASAERCPDLVLMDIRIKGRLDGVALAALLRSRFGIPVVYLTAHADYATISRAKLTEPHGYLIKPVRKAELGSAVELSLHRHRVECQLRERERWFATTLHSIADAVITVDLKGQVTFMNPAAETLLGQSAEQAKGQAIREVLRLCDEEQHAIDETPLERALREGHAVTLPQALLVDAAEMRHPISDSAAPVVQDGKTLGAVMVFRDVSQEQRLRRQLELADRLASLGTLAAGVAHEVNNPLAVISANTEYAMAALSDDHSTLPGGAEVLRALRDSLHETREAAARISRIVADLRLFAHPGDSGERFGTVVVERALRWALRVTAHELRHRARIVTEFHTVPAVRGDETKLGQVFVNLLVNAAHAMDVGRADENMLSATVDRDDEGRVVVSIRDTGCGMPPEVMRRIFDPFFTTKAVGKGVGLGLALSHGIVAGMGGSIEVESEERKGSLFRVRLPAGPPLGARRSEVPRAEVRAGRRGRLLIIDDDALVRSAVQRSLEREHEVITAEGGHEALALLGAGEDFDAVVCDVMMPNMTGPEFYQRLLARRLDYARRVVFLTGGITEARIEAFLQSVPNPRLVKPFTVAALRESLQMVLEPVP
jgi:PAS domain S-box-containing protein